jgi:phage-related protein
LYVARFEEAVYVLHAIIKKTLPAKPFDWPKPGMAI